MDEQGIEAALRTGPPDEPRYRGDIAGRLQAGGPAPVRAEPVSSVVDLEEARHRRRRSWPVLAGAAAAVVVLVVGLAALARPDRPQSAAQPTTPTTSAPSSSSEPGTFPAELVDRWVGATPSAVTTPNPSAPAFVVFSADQVTLEYLAGGIVNDFTSNVTATDADRLELTLVAQIGQCVAGATGDYRWSLSPQATTLTLESVSDECPDRAAALAGTWTHTACPTRGSDCLGRLEAGRYASVSFDPFDTGSFGQVTYAVPDGWSSTLDDRARLTLLRPDGDESSVHGIYLFADVALATAECPATPGAIVGMSAVVDAVSATPGLETTTSNGDVGGYVARTLDISYADPTCEGERPVLTSRPGGTTSWTLAIGEGRRMRIVLVDLPGDRIMAVVVASDRSASAYDALLDTSTAVIDSLELSPTP